MISIDNNCTPILIGDMMCVNKAKFVNKA